MEIKKKIYPKKSTQMVQGNFGDYQDTHMTCHCKIFTPTITMETNENNFMNTKVKGLFPPTLSADLHFRGRMKGD